MREYKASTKRGQALIAMSERCCWESLNNLYDSWSDKKQKAFDRCREQYANDNQSTAFGVGNANTFGFTCSWLTIIDGENVMRIETKDNSYLVWLDK